MQLFFSSHCVCITVVSLRDRTSATAMKFDIRRVLISDAVADVAVNLLANRGLVVDVKTNLSKPELIAAIKVSGGSCAVLHRCNNGVCFERITMR